MYLEALKPTPGSQVTSEFHESHRGHGLEYCELFHGDLPNQSHTIQALQNGQHTFFPHHCEVQVGTDRVDLPDDLPEP